MDLKETTSSTSQVKAYVWFFTHSIKEQLQGFSWKTAWGIAALHTGNRIQPVNCSFLEVVVRDSRAVEHWIKCEASLSSEPCGTSQVTHPCCCPCLCYIKYLIMCTSGHFVSPYFYSVVPSGFPHLRLETS